MKTKFKYLAIAVFSVTTLGACATSTPAMKSHSDTFGQANAANVTAHFVAPTPAQKANTYIPADQSRRALARDRYRKDNVEKPQPVGTMN